MNLCNPLVLLLVPACGVLILWSLFRSSTKSLVSWITALLRLSALCALSVSMSGPFTTTSHPADSLVAVVDLSSSVSDSLGDALLARARNLAATANIPLTILPFARTAAPSAATSTSSFSSLRQSWKRLDTEGTNLEKVLFTANNISGRSLLLLSDGYETEGSVTSSTSPPSDAPIYPLVLDQDSQDGVLQSSGLEISQLYAPLVAPAQKSVDIRTTVKNNSPGTQPALLQLKHGDKLVLTKDIELGPNKETVVLAASDPSAEGLNEITAILSWDDKSGLHQVSRTIWLAGEKREKVLILSGSGDDARLLPTILKGQAYQVQSVLAESGYSAIGKLTDYRVVIFNNIAHSQLPADIDRSLPDFIRSGGGFVMIGGNRSFGLGGYIDTPIEDLLPVKLVPPRTEKKRLNVAVQLVIDKSRSMATDNRLEFAKEAAAQVVRNLRDEDYIGIIGFDETPFIAQPMALLSEVRAQAVDRVNRLFPNRGTKLFSGMQDGLRGLTRVNAGRKHMIILTDGKIPDPSDYYYQLVRQMRTLGITVSTIMISTEADDELLSQIAAQGGGRFYHEVDPRTLPNIFLSDVRVNTGERTLKEASVFAVRPGLSGITSTHVTDFPTLRGYVECLRKEQAQLELVTLAEDKASPLLASWQVGKGRTLAFTSDANGRWSSEWMRWSDVTEFWSDIVDSVKPKVASVQKRFTFDLRSWVDRGELVLDLSLFEDPEGASIKTTLMLPNGTKKIVDLTLQSPGHYQARVASPMAGKYAAETLVGDTPLPEVAWSLGGELFGEQAHPRPNFQILEQLAAKSGGKINPSADELRSLVKAAVEKTDRSLTFLLLALLLFTIEILAREFLRLR